MEGPSIPFILPVLNLRFVPVAAGILKSCLFERNITQVTVKAVHALILNSYNLLPRCFRQMTQSGRPLFSGLRLIKNNEVEISKHKES